MSKRKNDNSLVQQTPPASTIALRSRQSKQQKQLKTPSSLATHHGRSEQLAVQQNVDTEDDASPDNDVNDEIQFKVALDHIDNSFDVRGSPVTVEHQHVQCLIKSLPDHLTQEEKDQATGFIHGNCDGLSRRPFDGKNRCRSPEAGTNRPGSEDSAALPSSLRLNTIFDGRITLQTADGDGCFVEFSDSAKSTETLYQCPYIDDREDQCLYKFVTPWGCERHMLSKHGAVTCREVECGYRQLDPEILEEKLAALRKGQVSQKPKGSPDYGRRKDSSDAGKTSKRTAGAKLAFLDPSDLCATTDFQYKKNKQQHSNTINKGKEVEHSANTVSSLNKLETVGEPVRTVVNETITEKRVQNAAKPATTVSGLDDLVQDLECNVANMTTASVLNAVQLPVTMLGVRMLSPIANTPNSNVANIGRAIAVEDVSSVEMTGFQGALDANPSAPDAIHTSETLPTGLRVKYSIIPLEPTSRNWELSDPRTPTKTSCMGDYQVALAQAKRMLHRHEEEKIQYSVMADAAMSLPRGPCHFCHNLRGPCKQCIILAENRSSFCSVITEAASDQQRIRHSRMMNSYFTTLLDLASESLPDGPCRDCTLVKGPCRLCLNVGCD